MLPTVILAVLAYTHNVVHTLLAHATHNFRSDHLYTKRKRTNRCASITNTRIAIARTARIA